MVKITNCSRRGGLATNGMGGTRSPIVAGVVALLQMVWEEQIHQCSRRGGLATNGTYLPYHVAGVVALQYKW